LATHEDGVYKRKDRDGYFLQWVDPNGKRRFAKATARYLDGAREERRQYIRGEHPKQTAGQTQRTEITFADVANKFLAYQKPRLSMEGYDREEGIAAHLKEVFGGKLLDITSSQVSDYLTVRLAKVSNASARKELVSLKHLFRLAYDEWEILPENHPSPTRKIKPQKCHDIERTQHLSPEQFRRVLVASPEKMRPIFALLTATGMRRSELLGCRWNYVDGNRILLPTSKNREPKEIHLNLFAQKALGSIPKGEPADRLFPHVSARAVSMAFHRVCQSLGLSDIRLHDLRHTFATWLRRRGAALDIIASQLGHRDLRMTKRYARIASVQVKRAVKRLDSNFEGARLSEPHATPALPKGCRSTSQRG
jgi:integrase